MLIVLPFRLRSYTYHSIVNVFETFIRLVVVYNKYYVCIHRYHTLIRTLTFCDSTPTTNGVLSLLFLTLVDPRMCRS